MSAGAVRVRLGEMRRDEARGIYLPPGAGCGPFAYSDGQALEDSILRSLDGVQDLSDNSGELLRHAKDWPTYYHLAPGRSNALRALDLPWDARILELGSGCGAVSRYLAEQFRAVDCIEGSERRASIGARRCSGLANARVFCADFKRVSLEPEYDVVLLNGVLEYAPLFYTSGSPEQSVQELLAFCRSGLKPSGALVVAIENKLGLKYWCGAPEDHTARAYDGLHGYPHGLKVRTYSRSELAIHLHRAGFGFVTPFYCFPDYKFTSTIFTDAAVTGAPFLHNWIDWPAEMPGSTRRYTMHEGLLTKSLCEAGLLGEAANSFVFLAFSSESAGPLVEVGRPRWLVKRLSVTQRDKAFHRMTTLRPAASGQGHEVVREPIHYSPRTAEPAGAERTASVEAFVPGELMLYDAARAVMCEQPEPRVNALLAEYHAELLRRFPPAGRDAEGYPLLPGKSVDMLMRNFIRGGGGLVAIDLEWDRGSPVPIDFLLFRCLWNDFFGSNRPWGWAVSVDRDTAMIAAIRTLYPAYDRGRHRANSRREGELLLHAGAVALQAEGGAGESGLRARLRRFLIDCFSLLPAELRRRLLRLADRLHDISRTLLQHA